MLSPCVYTLRRLALQMIVALFLVGPVAVQAQDYDRSAAVILAYERVGEDLYPNNNIASGQFALHISHLLDGEYHIVPLQDIVTALKTGAFLPDKTVAITFNGGYASPLQSAIPLLLEKNLPFTIFFSPDQAAANNPQYMSWDDIKRLSRYSQVSLGLHSASYTRLADQPEGEIKRQINNAVIATRKQLKLSPTFFAYPFGEYSKSFRDIVATSGFEAALAQQSGVAYVGSDLYALPRFAMTENYGDDDRFAMVVDALPLPVSDITPLNPRITASENPPIFGFTLDPSLIPYMGNLSCFISEHDKPAMQIIGKNRIELRMSEPFNNDRVRMNCTMPGPTVKKNEPQRWRWFGMLLSIDQPQDEPDPNAPSDGPFPN